MNPRDYRQRLDRLAHEHGYTVGRTKGDHLVLTKPGRRKVFAGLTPSDPKVLYLIARKIRKAEREAAAA